MEEEARLYREEQRRIAASAKDRVTFMLANVIINQVKHPSCIVHAVTRDILLTNCVLSIHIINPSPLITPANPLLLPPLNPILLLSSSLSSPLLTGGI